MSEENIKISEQNYGPGNVLRAKREEYEWSVEAVAEALHLSTHAVKAIEADRYEDLPGATYVIGYWRSYARLLGISIEETIEANKRNLNIVTAESAGMDIHRSIKKKRGFGAWLWLLPLMLLAALGYYSWQQQFFGLLDGMGSNDSDATQEQPKAMEEAQSEEDETVEPVQQVLRPLNTEQEETQEPAGEETESAPEQGDEQSMEAPTESVPESTSGLIMLESADDAQPAQPAFKIDSESGMLITSGSDDSAPPAENSVPDPEPVETETATQETEAEQTENATDSASNDPTTMLLVLSKDSWLDIRDKTNKRLIYKTETAGSELQVKGTPPFYVYIGTPDGVTVHYQGKVVPFETHKTGLFARFKLGEETLESL